MTNARSRRTLFALALSAIYGGFALAQTAGTTTNATATTATGTSGTTTTTSGTTATSGAAGGKLIASFTQLAGSPQNAAALVNGLRTGSAITLSSATVQGTSATATTSTTSTTAGGTAGSVTFTPPTKPMGYGNVRIALSLAQAQLGSQGITQPTPQQLQTALMGSGTTATGATGSTTQTQGILQMRADGMGWGQIANSTGFKLGAVMSGRTPTATAATAGTTTTAAGGTTTTSTTGGKSSVTSAGGSGGTTVHGKGTGVTSAAGSSAVHGKGSGIVSAGGSTTVASGLGRGNAGGASAGVVSAQGAAHGGAAGGGGQGRGKP